MNITTLQHFSPQNKKWGNRTKIEKECDQFQNPVKSVFCFPCENYKHNFFWQTDFISVVKEIDELTRMNGNAGPTTS